MPDSTISRRDFIKHSSAAVAGLAASSAIGGLPLGKEAMAEYYSETPIRKTNILFVFPDQHRFDWTGMNADLPLKTPALNALAARGTTFTNAICPSPLCAPCRAILATGKAYDNNPVKDNHIDMVDDAPTFYQLLRDAGYQVGGCGKFDLRKSAMSWGNDGQHVVNGKSIFEQWGFTHGLDSCGKHDGKNAWRRKKPEPYYHFLNQRGLAEKHVKDYKKRPYSNSFEYTKPTPLPDDAYADNWVGQHALDQINGFSKDKPWFLQINFPGPHEPMDCTQSMIDRWKGVDFPQPYKCKSFDEKKHVVIRRRYAAMIENIDMWLAKYIKAIKDRGELDDTLIVFSSDHGEMLGDHDLWMKKVPHQASIGVPLVIAGPAVKKQVVESATDILDLTGTFVESAQMSIPKDWDTRSLRPVLSGDNRSVREVATSALGQWRVVFDGRYKLVTGYEYGKKPKITKDGIAKAGPVYLFDLKTDPMEEKNLAQQEPKILARLKKHLPQA